MGRKQSKKSQCHIEVASVEYMKAIWSKYESIPNHYHEKTIKSISKNGHIDDDIVWCASEKVHGANFSLITNGVDLLAGSRNQILDETSRFFDGWRDVMEANKDKVIKAFKLLNKRYNDKIKVIIIYGEFFGGLYSHFDKKYMAKNKKCIQNGIFYSPSLHFYAFDIKTDLELNQIENKSEDEVDGRLSVNESIQIFEECDFLHAKILKQGSFDELMKFNVDKFQSTIPKILNLPPPIDVNTKKEIDNIAEGIIIRKLFSKDHILLKIKSQSFWEITGFKKQKNKTKNEILIKLDPKSEKIRQNVLKFQDAEFCDFISRCVNNQRLQSVESKVGRLDTKNFKKIQGMFVADVYDELQKEKNEITKKLHKTEIGKVRAFITALTENFLHEPKAIQNNSNISLKEKTEPKDVKLSKSQKRKLRMKRLQKCDESVELDEKKNEAEGKLSKSQKRRRRRKKVNKF